MACSTILQSLSCFVFFKMEEYWGGVCCFTANAVAVLVTAHDMIFNTRVLIYNNRVFIT